MPQSESSGWTIDTLHQHMVALITLHDQSYERRLAVQKEAQDVAFVAQQTALNVAAATHKEALAAALITTREALSFQIQAAREAVAKAEAATEKRFDNTNEWRQTITDRDKNMMPRLEADLMVRGLSDRISESLDRTVKLEMQVAAHMAATAAEGSVKQGVLAQRNWSVGILVAAAAAVGTLLGAMMQHWH